jgi:hypothetical protein
MSSDNNLGDHAGAQLRAVVSRSQFLDEVADIEEGECVLLCRIGPKGYRYTQFGDISQAEIVFVLELVKARIIDAANCDCATCNPDAE